MIAEEILPFLLIIGLITLLAWLFVKSYFGEIRIGKCRYILEKTHGLDWLALYPRIFNDYCERKAIVSIRLKGLRRARSYCARHALLIVQKVVDNARKEAEEILKDMPMRVIEYEEVEE